jgi:hypothetical protein
MERKFELPKMAQFPPFYTKQPNADTWAKQQELWIDYVTSYCRHHKVFQLPVDSKQKPFCNQEIQRKSLFLHRQFNKRNDFIDLGFDSQTRTGIMEQA